MKRYIVLDKKSGETPLTALTAWKTAHPEYANVPASYAGRLDPMAQGKLLILLGDECKKQNAYTGLDKEYVIEVLLDIGSDTGDALGLVEYADKQTRVSDAALAQALRTQRGKHTVPYPHFSSKTVNGKPLFMYALEGSLVTITIPEHVEHIYDLRQMSAVKITSQELRARIDTFLARVPKTNDAGKMLGADFRIDAVRAAWQQLFQQAGERQFVLVTLRVACGSGTYMRTLAGRIGKALGTSALALSITRTKIGKRLGPFWMKTFIKAS